MHRSAFQTVTQCPKLSVTRDQGPQTHTETWVGWRMSVGRLGRAGRCRLVSPESLALLPVQMTQQRRSCNSHAGGGVPACPGHRLVREQVFRPSLRLHSRPVWGARWGTHLGRSGCRTCPQRTSRRPSR